MVTTQEEPQEPLGASVLIVNSKGEYLLHLRDNIDGIWAPGTWSLLGGEPEDGECPEETVAREVMEEVGLSLEFHRLMVGDVHAPQGKPGKVVVFWARWDGDAHALPLTEGIMLHWFPGTVIPRLVTDPGLAEAIATYEAVHTRP
ncbi:NUDIX domain-containing protein [Streptomyces sp. NPDC058961]|uniref:NUDIX domain-containing protein n=1 Tax=Streptomyces sp. NPDC058961 TaxID=3346680 RepID=UPI00367CEA9A